MRATYDPSANAAYIQLSDRIGPGDVTQTRVASLEITNASLHVDFGADGTILGIEILGARALLPPGFLDEATDPD